MTATATKPHDNGTAEKQPDAKATRKPRQKKDGLLVSFRITDAKEIATLQKLAAEDRRSPENYVSLLTYKHLKSHVESAP